MILILATLNTKGAEALYLCEMLRGLGVEPFLMDLSMKHGDQLGATVSADQVALAGGSSLEFVSASRDMSNSMDVMTSGATNLARTLVQNGKIGGVIGIGGYTGTFMITAVMQTLPFGLPKIMVSSAAALPGLSNQFLKTSDIMLFHSVIEISGLTNPVRNILERAVHAMRGMLGGHIDAPLFDKNKAIAMTMLNICENCARSVRLAMEKEGYQVIGFHAAGISDRAMEEMILEGLFRMVIDLAPGGVGEHLYGFMRDAGPHRLEAAGKAGIPQIVSTCGINHITPSRSMTGPKYSERRTYQLDRFRTWFRMTPGELQEVSHVFADKLNRSSAPVRFLIPLRGWSSIESPGSPTYDPEEDALFTQGLKKMLNKEIKVIEVDANMEDPAFSAAVINAAFDLLRNSPAKG